MTSMMVVMENKKMPYKRARKVLAKQDPYVGIVLEEINGKLNTLIDGQEVLQGRANRLGSSMGRVEGRLDRVESRLDGVEIRLDRIDVRLNGVDIRLDRMETKFDVLADDVLQKVDKKDVSALEQRVVKLEL